MLTMDFQKVKKNIFETQMNEKKFNKISPHREREVLWQWSTLKTSECDFNGKSKLPPN